MGFLSRKLSDAEFEAEIKTLELEIEREKRKGELLKQRALIQSELAAVQAKAPASRWGEFFQKLGELGQNVNDNLAREHAEGRGWSIPDVSGEAPSIDFDNKGLTPVLGGDGVVAKQTKKQQKKKTKK